MQSEEKLFRAGLQVRRSTRLYAVHRQHTLSHARANTRSDQEPDERAHKEPYHRAYCKPDAVPDTGTHAEPNAGAHGSTDACTDTTPM